VILQIRRDCTSCVKRDKLHGKTVHLHFLISRLVEDLGLLRYYAILLGLVFCNISSFNTVGNTHPETQCHILEDKNTKTTTLHKNLRSCKK
jgi:hypothetical protein